MEAKETKIDITAELYSTLVVENRVDQLMIVVLSAAMMLIALLSSMPLWWSSIIAVFYGYFMWKKTMNIWSNSFQTRLRALIIDYSDCCLNFFIQQTRKHLEETKEEDSDNRPSNPSLN